MSSWSLCAVAWQSLPSPDLPSAGFLVPAVPPPPLQLLRQQPLRGVESWFNRQPISRPAENKPGDGLTAGCFQKMIEVLCLVLMFVNQVDLMPALRALGGDLGAMTI